MSNPTLHSPCYYCSHGNLMDCTMTLHRIFACALLLASIGLVAGCGDGAVDPGAPSSSTMPRYIWAGTDSSGFTHAGWTAPIDSNDVIGYRVWWWTVDEISSRSVDLNANERDMLLPDIRKGFPYVIEVAAITRSGLSSKAVTVYAASGSTASALAPRRIYTGYPYGGIKSEWTSIGVWWYDPADMSGLERYIIRWRPANEWVFVSNHMEDDPEERQSHDVVLSTKVPYFITIVAQHRDGRVDSISTVWLGAVGMGMNGTRPEPPRNVKATRIGSDSVRVSWDGSPCGGPVDYRVWGDCYLVKEYVPGNSGGSFFHDRRHDASYYYVASVRYGVESDPVLVSVGQ